MLLRGAVPTQEGIALKISSLTGHSQLGWRLEAERPAFALLTSPFVGLAGLEPAASSLSGIEGSALCGPAFPQVARERQGRRNAFLATSFQAVQASQTVLRASCGNSRIVEEVRRRASPSCRSARWQRPLLRINRSLLQLAG